MNNIGKSIQTQLEELLTSIENSLFNSFDSEVRATLMVAKSNTLIALQKYEQKEWIKEEF